MNRWKQVTARFAASAVQAGFTMIELLVVIAILGILATAVLSAINPIEQINRGRDTGSRSDAEQLLSAVERYNAFNGWYPWVSDAATVDTIGTTAATSQIVKRTAGGSYAAWLADGTVDGTAGADDCPVLARLSNGDTTVVDPCVGTDELKASFTSRIDESGYRPLWAYKATAGSGSSPHFCFVPRSQAFINEATTRCSQTQSTDFPVFACQGTLPTGAVGTAFGLDGDLDGTAGDIFICLP